MCEDSVSIVHDVPASLYPCDDAVGKAPRNRLFCIEITVLPCLFVYLFAGVAGMNVSDSFVAEILSWAYRGELPELVCDEIIYRIRGSHAHAHGTDGARDSRHHVIEGKAVRDRAAGAVDVHGDFFLRVCGI